MKKILVVATLSIAVAAVIKRATRSEYTVTLRLENKDELDALLESAKSSAEQFDHDLKALQNFTPNLNQD